MFHIKVERQLTSGIDKVFAQLSEHANYKQFKGVDDSSLLEQGKDTPNGIGALREIKAGKTVLHERIVEFQAPNRLAYIIEYSKPLPYQHELGQITLSENKQGTLAVWESKGHIGIPLLGTWYFDKQIQKHGGRAFASILKSIDMQ